MIQYGMPILIENRTMKENVDLCHRLGLGFIELNMNFTECQLDVLEQADDLIRLGEQAGLFYTIHLDENLDIADFNPLVARAYLETVRRTVKTAQKLVGLKDRYGDRNRPLIINMHMNHGIHTILPDRKVQMYERDFAAYMKAFVHFRERCEEWIAAVM